MSTTEASSSQLNEKLSHPPTFLASSNAAGKEWHTLPDTTPFVFLHFSKIYFADFRAGRFQGR